MKTGFIHPEDIPTITHDTEMYDARGIPVIGIVDSISEHHEIYKEWLTKEIDIKATFGTVANTMFLMMELHDNGKNIMEFTIKIQDEKHAQMLLWDKHLLILDKTGEFRFGVQLPALNELQEIMRLYIAQKMICEALGFDPVKRKWK